VPVSALATAFAFSGRLPRLRYAAAALGVFASQYVMVALAYRLDGQTPAFDPGLYLLPLRALALLPGAPDWVLVGALVYFVLSTWVLAALTFRRAIDAAINPWLAAFVIAPIVQVPVILALCVLPSRAARDGPSDGQRVPAPAWAAASLGALSSMALAPIAVAVGALGFRSYGVGLFVVAPFLIGAVAAYIANRKGDLGGWSTARIVSLATVLGGVALMAASLEGAVCIVMAAPLGLGVALIGGALGRSIALRNEQTPTRTLSIFAVLPAIFAVEDLFPLSMQFDTAETIAIAAPPPAVWHAIVHMAPIDAPPDLPFRLGFAYPLGGEITGEGVGAVRLGRFSTGIARERISEWNPDRKLALDVLDDIPALHELSPYPEVHAPHAVGYFRTTRMSFELVREPDGTTTLIERTSHALRLEPVLYWLPMARWAIHQNNTRVLAHIRDQAEAGD
jgi:uncharacterized membrane protein YhaH (DUF805 family)